MALVKVLYTIFWLSSKTWCVPSTLYLSSSETITNRGHLWMLRASAFCAVGSEPTLRSAVCGVVKRRCAATLLGVLRIVVVFDCSLLGMFFGFTSSTLKWPSQADSIENHSQRGLKANSRMFDFLTCPSALLSDCFVAWKVFVFNHTFDALIAVYLLDRRKIKPALPNGHAKGRGKGTT